MVSGRIIAIIGVVAVIAGVMGIAYNYNRVVQTQNVANVAKQDLVKTCMSEKYLVMNLSSLATSPKDPNEMSAVDHYNAHCAQYTGELTLK